jgi:hypothetical protein
MTDFVSYLIVVGMIIVVASFYGGGDDSDAGYHSTQTR